MSEAASWIHAFKPCDESGGITSCDLDDAAATLFRVHWRGSLFSSTAIDCDTKYKAEWIVIAANDAFEAGKRQRNYEIRQLLGISGRY